MSQSDILIEGNERNIREGVSERRGFLQFCGLTLCSVALTAVPLASYVIWPSFKKETGRWIDFGTARELEGDNFRMLSYEFMVKDGWQILPQRGFVWAKSNPGGAIKVFSSTCTHLACNVVWREDTQVFECPCHSGRFDPEGRPVAGPPTKPLVRLEHKIQDGNLMVFLNV